MRPAQNKRMRGRNTNNRKGPNPLTRSFESNGPDVKIRGTAQHVAEKYLQLARDAQSSGDTIMAESLLQHAEHYFRLIAAAQSAQQQAGAYGRQSGEADVDDEDDDDDFVSLPDRFASLSERLPQASFPAPAPPYQPQPPQPQPHFAQPQPQPQPFEERPIGEQRHERPNRPERPFGERGRDRGRERGPDRNADRNVEGGERANHQNFDRNRDSRRFQQRGDATPAENQNSAPEPASAAGLPSFITAPVRTAGAEQDAPEQFLGQDRGAGREHEGGGGYHLASRRRQRPQPPIGDANGATQGEEAPQPGELPLGD